MTPSDDSGLYRDGLYGDAGRSGDSEEEQPRVVIRDKRRIDPETGAVRGVQDSPPVPPVPSGVTEDDTGVAEMAKELAERTEDLKRVSAEYANYRRRVDRDRIMTSEMAQDRLVLDVLPVMDDIDRAREHGDLTGSFKSTADQLAAVLDRAGVQAFGAIGDPFDPALHEAVLHAETPEVDVPTCTHVMRLGYRRGERVLRAAMVGVADPATEATVNGSAQDVAPSTED